MTARKDEHICRLRVNCLKFATAVKNSEFIRVMTRLETKIDNLADKDRRGN